MNKFAYRFWWLVLLLFILGVVLFYLFCSGSQQCDSFKTALGATNNAIENSSNCCSCAPPEDVIPCNTSTSESGGQGYHENTHWIGNYPGTIFINFDMYNQKDKMDVYYDNQLVASTNEVVSNKGTLEFYYSAQPGKPKYCRIIMTAPESGTAWEYLLSCPE